MDTEGTVLSVFEITAKGLAAMRAPSLLFGSQEHTRDQARCALPDRGYEHIEDRLNALGAIIKRG